MCNVGRAPLYICNVVANVFFDSFMSSTNSFEFSAIANILFSPTSEAMLEALCLGIIFLPVTLC